MPGLPTLDSHSSSRYQQFDLGESLPLTEQQARFFDVFGYLSFPGLFNDEAEALTEAFDAVWAEHGGGHNQRPHDHKQNSALLPFIYQHPYLCALLDDERDEAIAYFQGKLETTAEEEDKQMIAYVLVDLLGRIDLQEQAINLASQHLAHVDESSGFNFAEFCHSADRLDLLRNAARDRGDLVTWTAAMLGDATTTAASND